MKLDKYYNWIFVAILIVAATLQIWPALNSGQTIDSFMHTANARNLAQGGENEYARAELYTRAVAISYEIFGANELTTHLPNILANLLLIAAIYFLGRKIFNPEAALAGSLLYTLSFWSIGEAANVRMYILFSLFAFLFFYAFYRFLFATPIFKEPGEYFQQTMFRKWPYVLFILALFLIAYHLHDLVGLLVFAFIVFLPIALIVCIIDDARRNKPFQTSKRTDNILYILLYLNLLVGLVFIFWPDPIGQIESNLKWNSEALGGLKALSESPRNALGWFLDLYKPWILYVSLSIFLAYSIRTKKLNYFFWLLSFLAPALAGLLFINRYFSPRYYLFLLPILVLIIGFALNYAAGLAIKNPKLKLATVFLIILLITPWPKIKTALSFNFGENLNQEIYYDFKGIVSKVDIRPEDFLAETSSGPFILYQDKSKNIFNLSRLSLDGAGREIPIKEIERRFFEAIWKYKRGYFLTDYYRFEKWPCEEYIPCSVRKYVIQHPELFTPVPHTPDPNLLHFRFEK